MSDHIDIRIERTPRNRSETLPYSVNLLHFPSAEHNFSKAISALDRAKKSVIIHLLSILEDAKFVNAVAERARLPIIANERCGSWYVDPKLKAGSTYFKSTDGHFGQWKFNLRRLNLQLFDHLEEHGGCVIIDSTKRGKSMPDALSKTLPIWTCIMNRLLFPEHKYYHHLRLPENVVSASERSQIESHLANFLEAAKHLHLDLPSLRTKLSKPIYLEWITPSLWERVIPTTGPLDHNVIIACTTSRFDPNSHLKSTYIQGAADDHENWGKGLDLSPEMLWGIQTDGNLPVSTDEELLDLLNDRGHKDLDKTVPEHPVAIQKIDTELLLASVGALWLEKASGPVSCLVSCSGERQVPDLESMDAGRSSVLKFVSGPKKLASRALRNQLPEIQRFLDQKLKPECCVQGSSSILVACTTGRDISVGIALAVLCMHFDDEGKFFFPAKLKGHSKTSIKQRLAWIGQSIPDMSPSSTTLQAVNAFLMKPP